MCKHMCKPYKLVPIIRLIVYVMKCHKVYSKSVNFIWFALISQDTFGFFFVCACQLDAANWSFCCFFHDYKFVTILWWLFIHWNGANICASNPKIMHSNFESIKSNLLDSNIFVQQIKMSAIHSYSMHDV